MKIQVVSDIHLEFGPISIENAGDTDVLILSGDICVANDLAERDAFCLRGEHDKSNKFHTFFQECCARFPHVVYIMGNHEHYHGDFSKSLSILRDRLGYLVNLHILEKGSVIIDDVLFIGGTLWTDMNGENPEHINAIKGYMNDYRIIQCSDEPDMSVPNIMLKNKPVGMTDEEWMGLSFADRVEVVSEKRPAKFSPERSIKEHKETMEYIRTQLATTSLTKAVVVGHHAPSKKSTKPQYERDVVVNGAYSTELTEFILDHPIIKLWTHGHTHHNFDYMIGDTRIFCNPRGYYRYEENLEFTPTTVIEV